MTAPDPLQGYKGRARARLSLFGVRVWSDVRATNDAGSVFEGVILPRSETLDDEHVVIKLKTGYNVGLHVDRVNGNQGAESTLAFLLSLAEMRLAQNILTSFREPLAAAN